MAMEEVDFQAGVAEEGEGADAEDEVGASAACELGEEGAGGDAESVDGARDIGDGDDVGEGAWVVAGEAWAEAEVVVVAAAVASEAVLVPSAS
ncbi:unnamed protein product [Fusarium graminearum]|nr:unnamed protein product [Fusarium graminearum]